MPAISPPAADHTATTAPAGRRPGHRPLRFDRAVIVALGACGSVLSFNALRQVGVAIHSGTQLSYLFPLVIDGFIAYGVRAILLLRDAPLRARLYAWFLFALATAASLWANALHAVRLNQPGVHVLILGDQAVGVLSMVAPLALAGATHLHILVTRQAAQPGIPDTDQPVTTTQGDLPRTDFARPDFGTADGNVPILGTGQDVPHATAPTALTSVPEIPALEPVAAEPPSAPVAENDEDPGAEPVPEALPGQAGGGRPRMATPEQLSKAILAAHPDPGTITRTSARKAIADAGLGVGTQRLQELVTELRRQPTARPHPEQD
ncbi:DUF2637 domain-containing protein [Streptacidiphilus melanogenes]|uniref:DUF2637 domain-containing protein n=1 Tax=Streptacidiphilus melanogenes TaxID=411235 RepID=UPI0006942359|nr:DUF2637 domain-containing protein [Streptacidiphilus melanogenes]